MAKNAAKLALELGYHFQTTSLLNLALTHSSHSRDNNQRLEFLGDTVLDIIISEELYRRYPESPEGDLSRMRAGLVSGSALAELAAEFQLGKYLKLGVGEAKTGGARRESNLANALEAVIGAIYLDSDLPSCRQCVLRWYEARMAHMRPGGRDAKTALQEYLQARGEALPIYEVVKTEGEAHQLQFTVSCEVKGLAKAELASHTNRRGAEQAAAAAVLLKLGVDNA